MRNFIVAYLLFLLIGTHTPALSDLYIDGTKHSDPASGAAAAAETDPIWVAASNGVPYLDSIQTFAETNTFTKVVLLSTDATNGTEAVNYQTMTAYVQDSWAESETVTYAATTTVLRTHGAYPWLYATGDCEITMEAGAWATNGIGIVGLTLYHTSSETITFDAALINATDAGALTLEPQTNQLLILTKPRGETVWRIK